ncbi:hypothetical protein [Rhizomicrobium electricum]|jgi:hypothetical protein|uniref:Uncharacterized protein n=1 Tax=Rhizomicrobium electricum TaxID=480070 RepID=A0ABN1E0P3_9PROT|nr:hypothetical protein [Rhizomicrobium electricum]NIJ47370.1 hypothetical protein [Rhizomicrobium electricum]
MKKLILFALAAGLAGVTAANAADPAQPAKPRQICIRTSDINSMSYPDNRTILFRMNGGPVKVWRNELPRECPGLKFEQGIAWQIWGGEVCSNMQVFYVLRRGTPCMLGTFVPADQPRQDGWAPPEKK